MPDEQATAVEAAVAPPAPAMLAIGAAHDDTTGLELTVLGIAKAPAADAAAGASTRLVLRVRVRNSGDAPREFENNFGVLDHTGMVHRRTWANPAHFPDALPGAASLDAGAAIEGDVLVLVPGADAIPTAALRAAFLGVVTGCGGCDAGVTLFPVVVWQED